MWGKARTNWNPWGRTGTHEDKLKPASVSVSSHKDGGPAEGARALHLGLHAHWLRSQRGWRRRPSGSCLSQEGKPAEQSELPQGPMCCTHLQRVTRPRLCSPLRVSCRLLIWPTLIWNHTGKWVWKKCNSSLADLTQCETSTRTKWKF